MGGKSLERPRWPMQAGSTSFSERRELLSVVIPCMDEVLLSIVIPCMNEEAVLRETHRRLKGVLEGISLNFEIIYLGDRSTDSTPDLLHQLPTHDFRCPGIRVFRH